MGDGFLVRLNETIKPSGEEYFIAEEKIFEVVSIADKKEWVVGHFEISELRHARGRGHPDVFKSIGFPLSRE